MSFSPEYDIEDLIRREFRSASDELERASGDYKADAAARLNHAIRKLYDFVGYGRVSTDLQFRRPHSVCPSRESN